MLLTEAVTCMNFNICHLRRIVAAYRAWMAGRGKGGPVPLQDAGPMLPKQELLNRFTQHVQKCPSCSKVIFSDFFACCSCKTISSFQ